MTRLEEWAPLFDEGLRDTEIAKRSGVSVSRVNQIRKKYATLKNTSTNDDFSSFLVRELARIGCPKWETTRIANAVTRGAYTPTPDLYCDSKEDVIDMWTYIQDHINDPRHRGSFRLLGPRGYGKTSHEWIGRLVEDWRK